MYFVNQVPAFKPSSFHKIPDLAGEVNLLACSVRAVNMYGGPIAKQVLTDIDTLYEYSISRAANCGLVPVVDVRVHHLLPGQFAAVPGWHCDMVPFGGYTGQPNFSLAHPEAFHVSIVLSSEHAGVSSTEFVNTVIRPNIWDKEHVYKCLNDEVIRIAPQIVSPKDGEFVWYNQRTICRESPARRAGTRFYMRFSMVEKPMLVNEVIHHPQVYVIKD